MQTGAILYLVWCGLVVTGFAVASSSGSSPFATAGRGAMHSVGFYGPMHK